MKGNRKKGFTLSEMLIAVLILSLVTAGVTMTVSLALRHYDRSMRDSESWTLLSSLKSVVESELAYTTEIHVDEEGNLISFQSQNYAIQDNLSTWTTDQVVLGENGNAHCKPGVVALGNPADLSEQMPVLGEGIYSRNLRAMVSEATYESESHYFTVTLIITYKDEVIRTETFQVKNVNNTMAY